MLILLYILFLPPPLYLASPLVSATKGSRLCPQEISLENGDSRQGSHHCVVLPTIYNKRLDLSCHFHPRGIFDGYIFPTPATHQTAGSSPSSYPFSLLLSSFWIAQLLTPQISVYFLAKEVQQSLCLTAFQKASCW